MINKDNYRKTKIYIKNLSRPQVKELCDNLEFNDLERNILMGVYDGDLVVKICMNNFICEATYAKYVKIVFSKVYNYLNYTNVTF